MQVLKFGGTSLGSPENMRHVAGIIENGEQKVVVLSAISGTTDKLIEIIRLLKKYNRIKAQEKISDFKLEYDRFIRKLFNDRTYIRRLERIVHKSFEEMHSLLPENLSILAEREILAQGEILSTEIFQALLESKGIKSRLIYALNFMRTDKDGEPDMYFIKINLGKS
jgi:aspartate kinase